MPMRRWPQARQQYALALNANPESQGDCATLGNLVYMGDDDFRRTVDRVAKGVASGRLHRNLLA